MLRNAIASVALLCAVCSLGLTGKALAAEDQARVFITDSNSWEVHSSSGGSGGVFASHGSGGARPQTAEIIKTFGERCPNVVINNKQDKANYIVLLDHEGGKGFLQHRNKVAVFNSASGDSIVSHSTLSLGSSVQTACAAISNDWTAHGAAMRAAASAKEAAAAPAQATKVSITSVPDGADIEIDGSFVGNTPSTAELTTGDHTIAVTKSGYKAWERKMKAGGGDVRINAELEKK
jgi:ABC-type phosphate transport system substrate-binding protein